MSDEKDFPMERYGVGTIDEFKVKKLVDGELVETGDVIAYLVCHKWADEKHYSYGYDPKQMTEEQARVAFLQELSNNTATPYDPDGGSLDGGKK